MGSEAGREAVGSEAGREAVLADAGCTVGGEGEDGDDRTSGLRLSFFSLVAAAPDEEAAADLTARTSPSPA